jgi:hypothetical protein
MITIIAIRRQNTKKDEHYQRVETSHIKSVEGIVPAGISGK